MPGERQTLTIVIRKGETEELRAHQPHGSFQESDGAGFRGRYFKGVRTQPE